MSSNTASETTPAEQTQPRRAIRRSSSRDTVESVVFALILAFLFRTFEAEAFVIPTGSMAPTLMGRHKDLACDECGFLWQASASEEIDSYTGQRLRDLIDPQTGQPYRDADVQAVTCPNCRHTMLVGPDNPSEQPYRSYSGDRIIASKLPYVLSNPQRWDVVVFRYPEEPRTNFIKRLVGLPNETVRIAHGDIYTARPDSSDFEIARKSPAQVRALLQMVYDNDCLPLRLQEHGWPARWQPENSTEATEASGTWQGLDDGRSFAIESSSGDEAWLRYRHFAPTWEDWHELRDGPLPDDYPLRPQLISDFYGYNTAELSPYDPAPTPQAMHWVGDLALDVQISAARSEGSVILELIKGGQRFRCQFDLATGEALLSIDGQPDFVARADTMVRGPGRFDVSFANVDHQLLLWVDGREIEFDRSTSYENGTYLRPQRADLSPVGIASRGAAVEVSHLKILRDVYYVAAQAGEARAQPPMTDFDSHEADELFGGWTRHLTRPRLASFLSDPERWDAFERLRPIEFMLDEDQYFVLGDNSPCSRDSRLWDDAYWVDRHLLIAKPCWFIGPMPGKPLTA